MIQIHNDIFTVDIDKQRAWFSIHPRNVIFPSLEKIRIGCEYLITGKSFISNGEIKLENDPERGVVDTVEHGRIETVTLRFGADANGISSRFTIGIMQEYPLVIWKLCVENNGTVPIEIQKLNMLKVDPDREGRINYSSTRTNVELGFFSNGWQSWSPARWYNADAQMIISRLGLLQHPMIYNTGTPLPRGKGVFSSDMFAVIGDRKARTGFLVGFLSQKQHFGSILADFNRRSLEMWANGDNARLDPGKAIESDWAVFNPVLLDHRDPLGKYLDAVGRENHTCVPEEPPVGWCSWYHFYTRVTAADVKENLKAILEQQERLPIQLVQIDDGFESQAGDWFDFKDTFPQGVAPLAKDISKEGLIPGLWLAPFIVHRKSNLFKQHPEWILRKANGKPVNAGFVWKSLCTALDLTIPEALEYACSVVRTASTKWGFPYLKLDFLYAAALPGQYRDRTLSRAQVLRKGMEAIREAAGSNVTLLGCGAPMGSMLGLVEAMRIGPDVSGDWAPHFHGIGAVIRNEPGFPCARNSIHNILTRANLHRRWWVNDPDCLLIRPETNLSLDEVRTLAASIAMTGGALLLSDDLPRLTQERLKIAEVLLPVLNERARVMDWFDASMPSSLRLDLVNDTGAWYLLSAFNWQDTPADINICADDFQLEVGKYLVREFLSGKTDWLTESAGITFKNVPAHGCVLLAVRRVEGDLPVYLGSSLHFSQGMEVVEFHRDETSVQAVLRLPRCANGEIVFYFAKTPRAAEVNGLPVVLKEVSPNLYSLPVEVDGFAHVEIKY